MFKRKFTAVILSSCLMLGMLLSGCAKITGVEPMHLIAVTQGLQMYNIVSQTEGDVEPLSDSEYGDKYTARQIITITCKIGGKENALPQTVTKDLIFLYDKDQQNWSYYDETLKACDVDNSSLPGTSWKCVNLDSDSVTGLFGGEIPSGENGVLYFRFMKKMGLFAFNLSNENNTSDQRFFATVGTGVKAYWVSDSGIYESSIDVTGGSVTNDGALYLDFESDGAALNINLWEDAAQISEQEYDEAVGKDVGSSKVYMDQLPIFEVTTTSIMEGEWKRDCGLKEGNLSPELTWQPVEGATKYAVIMLDVSTNNWLSWYVITDKTHLDEGEYTDQSVYVGPYPAETHTYELYVVALKGDPQELNFPIDTSGGDIHQKMDFLNTASDGSTGNVIAYGNITAPYTSPELYYGYR